MEQVILVNENDEEIGLMEKQQAHENGGKLHRAFSGFVFNDKNELLIQQRASHKYHNPNIWANTVCSHPRKGESIIDAVKRRLFEELGFIENFSKIGSLIYKASFSNGLTEWEYDHICIANYSGGVIIPNSDQVANVRWISVGDLKKEISETPENFSYWLKEIIKTKNFDKVLAK